MSHRATVRCPSCGTVVSVKVVWAIHDICPQCMEPLSGAASQGESEAPSATRPAEPEVIVAKWLDAFNVRDLDGMLALMDERIEFHPLRLPGLESAYRGHDGVRSWFAQLVEMEHRHRIELTEVRNTRDDRLLAVGFVQIDDDADRAPFWALERVARGMIVSAYHYLTDPEVFDHGGLLTP
jgi:hypothetical protein